MSDSQLDQSEECTEIRLLGNVKNLNNGANGAKSVYFLTHPHPKIHEVHHCCKSIDHNKIYDACSKALKGIEIRKKKAGEPFCITVFELRAEKPDQSPFYVVDLTKPVLQYEHWQKYLSRVHPHYAVKCNSDVGIIAALAEAGAGFDCATPQEMDIVLKLGVEPSRIIYANPCKTPLYVKEASDKGVFRMTFDNEEEIDKMMQNCPNVEMVLRLATDDSKAVLGFSSKFGASVVEAKRLVQICFEKKANLIGCSFHVGSGCIDTSAYETALENVREIFDFAKKRRYYELKFIDLGGGWPGSDSHVNTPAPEDGGKVPKFREFAKVVTNTLDELFPKIEGYEIIAEPGRYFATDTTILACSVIARRPNYRNLKESDGIDVSKKKFESWKYYLSDGIYGSMNNALTDHVHPIPKVLYSLQNPDLHVKEKKLPCTLFGPTCDSLDTITKKQVKLPELYINDWLYFVRFGAYTQSLETHFNGFPPAAPYYVFTVPSDYVTPPSTPLSSPLDLPHKKRKM